MKGRFENFTVLIANINRCIKRIKTAEMGEYHLKSPHLSALYYLNKESGLTAAELCSLCKEDKAAMSRALDYLEKNGYIFPSAAANKNYRRPLRLTEKGEKTALDIAKKTDRILEMASAGLSEEYRAVMYESLALINENLDKICENYEEK